MVSSKCQQHQCVCCGIRQPFTGLSADGLCIACSLGDEIKEESRHDTDRPPPSEHIDWAEK
jgi:hypothetical protein